LKNASAILPKTEISVSYNVGINKSKMCES
jgi:hypothetical protein